MAELYDVTKKELIPGSGWSLAVDRARHMVDPARYVGHLGAILGLVSHQESKDVNLDAFADATVPPLSYSEREIVGSSVDETRYMLTAVEKYKGATA